VRISRRFYGRPTGDRVGANRVASEKSSTFAEAADLCGGRPLRIGCREKSSWLRSSRTSRGY